MGSKAATRADFAYSGALEASGLTWSPGNLDRFVAAPQQLVPGTLMASVGITREADRQALLAFLAAGAPWFFTLFGRDSIWAARFLLPLGTGIAVDSVTTVPVVAPVVPLSSISVVSVPPPKPEIGVVPLPSV